MGHFQGLSKIIKDSEVLKWCLEGPQIMNLPICTVEFLGIQMCVFITQRNSSRGMKIFRLRADNTDTPQTVGMGVSVDVGVCYKLVCSFKTKPLSTQLVCALCSWYMRTIYKTHQNMGAL